ncbi:MAG: glycoside hydrolase family 2 TIM barrel-domain containing protein [Verrucomicrobiales bacterium]|nr:glycoside hydrolase family 2 TIM barrel-domain containing protein [Verrucomicrobiales bacterium]
MKHTPIKSLAGNLLRRVAPLAFCCSAIFMLHAGPRADVELDSGWRFEQADPTNAEQVSFPDARWTTVSLPHNWGWEQAQRGETYLRGPGWYRRELDLQPKAGRRYFLRFEAASTVADVYLNGKLLGGHRGGFGAFCFELTKDLSETGTNLLAVRVDNAPQPDIAPLSGDFSVYGGLYRPVHLIETGETCIAPTDHGSPGIAWLQTSVSPTQAVLDVTAQISNAAKKGRALTLVAKVLDADGNQIAGSEEKITPATGVTAPYFLRVVVPQPHLWNGRKDPYLYQAVVELRTADEAVDSVTQPVGLRYYRVDPDLGFFLNGQPYHLHGVNKHQDRPVKGWAVSDADLAEDVNLISEIGATVVRCAHYQHSDYFYSLCDKAGILVWAEIPQVNEINSSPEFEETSRNQLLDLIRQNINHPAIFTWSLFNEIGLVKTQDPHRELQDLDNVAHGEDPTRPTIGATFTSEFPQMNKIPDLLGWNTYPGWYSSWGSKGDFGGWLDKHRHDSRHGGFCVSEYGAGANVAQHEQNPRQPKPTGQWHPEEWQALVHEEAWKQMKSRPFVWGTFVWNMFDFVVSTRHEGGVAGLNDKGLVTYDRQTRKDAFYFYKANWSEDPTLHITDQRFIERTNAVTDVKIYSNAGEVKLFLNAASQGSRTNDGNTVFIWKDVQLKPGENTVEARAQIHGTNVSDRCLWNLK